MMKISTDKKWKQFKYRDEVPASVLERQFDYLDEEEFDGFFQYKGYWYHLSGFMAVPRDADELKGWDGYASDSYFSGIVIKVSPDGEEYIVGTYIS